MMVRTGKQFTSLDSCDGVLGATEDGIEFEGNREALLDDEEEEEEEGASLSARRRDERR